MPNYGSLIGELRRLSGLDWDKLAQLLWVNRQELHSWASGKQMSDIINEHLRQVLDVLRKIDRGTAGANRTVLFETRDEVTPFFLLINGNYEQVIKLLKDGKKERQQAPSISMEELNERAPLSLEILVNTVWD